MKQVWRRLKYEFERLFLTNFPGFSEILKSFMGRWIGRTVVGPRILWTQSILLRGDIIWPLHLTSNGKERIQAAAADGVMDSAHGGEVAEGSPDGVSVGQSSPRADQE
jgi:hypothetical protein